MIKMYLLVFIFNVVDLEPVIIKDCANYDKIEHIQSAIDESISFLSSLGYKCEKKEGIIEWNCSDNKNMFGKIIAFKELDNCESTPDFIISNIKKMIEYHKK